MAKVALKDLPGVAGEVLNHLPPVKGRATILALQGNLGAGKTTFVQVLARELGVSDAVQSPTYVLMKSYPLKQGRFKTLVHIDAYRLEMPKEFSALKPHTFLDDENNLVCIEWPEKIEGELPTPDRVITFSAEGTGEQERYIEIV